MVNQAAEAIDPYKKAIKINEISPEFHYNLASAYMELGEFQKAMNSFWNCLKYDSQNADAYYNIGKIFAEKEQKFGEAKKSFEKALHFNPRHEKAQTALSRLEETTEEK